MTAKITKDTESRRNQIIHRLSESGFKPETIDQILLMIDAIMTGHTPLAHVLVAATEVCRACQLSSTHQHVADALASLAGEVVHYEDPSLEVHAGTPDRARSGNACWNDKRRGRGGQAQA
jgi:hypothetical protein